MRIEKLIKNPYRIFSVLAVRGVFNRLPDKQFVKMQYRAQIGKWPDLEEPKTFNEKIQWLKLYDRRPEYTTIVDKYLVRQYIADTLGKEYLIPLLGVWDRPEDIDFDALPDRFVLKCNHNSGTGMYFCKDKSKMDRKKVLRELDKSLKQDYYLTGREWPYKNVPRKVICEKYMEDSRLQELRDYKFFCFNGEVKYFKIDFDRFTGHRANYYDLEMNPLSLVETCYPPDFDRDVEKPKNFDKMVAFATKLSAGHPFLRVDFYEVDGQLFFGELTLHPSSGFTPFMPESWDYTLGEWIKLPKEKYLGD